VVEEEQLLGEQRLIGEIGKGPCVPIALEIGTEDRNGAAYRACGRAAPTTR